jgi:hypothetical protein
MPPFGCGSIIPCHDNEAGVLGLPIVPPKRRAALLRLGLPPEQPSDDDRRNFLGELWADFLDGQLPGSGWDPPKRYRKRRLPRIKGVEILDELQTRNVPTVVVRQKIERRRVGVPLPLEQHAEVGVAKVAEHQARHVAGS